MKRFQVEFQGRTINMSLPKAGVISAIISCVDRSDKETKSPEEVTLHLGGLDSTDGKHPQWGEFALSPGDKVVISIHDDQKRDPPNERRGFSREETEKEKRDYVRKMAAEWGWKLTETT